MLIKILKAISKKMVLASIISASILSFSISDIDLGDINEMELREHVNIVIKKFFKPLKEYENHENYEINYEFSDYMNGKY